jgi:uncharacterized protein with GYD domain
VRIVGDAFAAATAGPEHPMHTAAIVASPNFTCRFETDNAGPWYKCRFTKVPIRHVEQEVVVPTYIMLTTLTPEGVQTIKNNPSRIREVNREIEQLGATVKAQWATLGQFDFVNVVEAPDEKVIARVSLELGSRGTGKYETLSAIPIDDFIGAI